MKDRKAQNIRGKEYWRSLDQLADTPQYRELLHREFPEGASEMNNDWSRRNFIALMGASLALAGLAGCRRPKEKIVPYVKPPEEVIPGVPQYYATTMPFGAGAYGVVVESHEGRPTKIEGNKLHPSSLGASNSWIQASILGLYDPDRSRCVIHDGQEQTWDDFVTFWRTVYGDYKTNKGEGLAVLSEAYASPSMARLRREFEKTYPKATWVTWEPVSDENIYAGTASAFGTACQPVYDFRKAEVILALDHDFALTESENIAHAKGFASGRKVESENAPMNRLYEVEIGFSTTGAIADHRLRLKPSQIGSFVLTLAATLKTQGLTLDLPEGIRLELSEEVRSWLEPLARDLMRTRGKSLVIAGRRQPAEVQALVCAINEALGNVGQTVVYRELTDTAISNVASLKALSERMREGRISTLVIMGANPAYAAPVDLEWSKAMAKVGTTVHLGLYRDETAKMCRWHISQAHYLENWSDARSLDGTMSVVQPLIEPLYGGKSTVELVNLLATGANTGGYDIVRATWQGLLPGLDFESRWRKLLHDGVLPDSAAKAVKTRLSNDAIRAASTLISSNHAGAADDTLEVIFTLSASVYDGRFANNGWLQELPDSATKISWDNVTQLSPRTAKRLGLENEDLVRIVFDGREITMPVWIVPGVADNCVLLELGYGREGIGRVANGVGFNAYLLRASQAPDFGRGATITKTNRKYELANTQDHGSMEGRPHVREASLEEYRHEPTFAPEAVEHPPLVSMWQDHKYDIGYQWGMSIDLTACTGCNACTIACQSENNIPIVGKTQVRKGREMHWIRIDRYFTGDTVKPQMVHQPVACQHCEMAPCEQVCPVAATVHDDEGLNVMVYNRCIGTRYCANNCPYKVRRFNFFNFTKDTPETVKMAQNPDVTVRSRGVMEKCTYCLQRINRVKIEAKKDGREIVDGEVVSACQQVCPTDAIVFGDINDPSSRVAKMKKRNRRYDLLGELNVRPRTSYLAKIRNPNPEMPEPA